MNNKKWKKIIGTIFVLLCVASAIGFYLFSKMDKTIDLSSNSKNVSVKYIDDIEKAKTTKFNLVELSENDIFSKENLLIFRGIIKEIKNIEINYNGEIEYNSIIKIKVNKILLGKDIEDEIITVLAPCAIGDNVFYEDCETVSGFKVGFEGIFMPIKYTQNDISQLNDAKLMLTDIAQYGFFDGSRFAFLESKKGLVYSTHTYKSLKNHNSLEQVEAYINKMIQ